MTALLKCAVHERFTVIATVEGGTDLTRGGTSNQITLQVTERESSDPLITKFIPWPTGEELPSDLKYDKEEEIISMRNRTTLARIPFRTRALLSLSHNSATKSSAESTIFSSFGTVDQEKQTYSNKALIAVKKLIKSDAPEAVRWDKVRKALSTSKAGSDSSSGEGVLAMLLSHAHQKELLARLESAHASGEDIADITQLLIVSGAFGYRFSKSLSRSSSISRPVFLKYTPSRVLDSVYVFCENASLAAVCSVFSSTSVIAPEVTFVKVLKQAARSKSAKKGQEMILRAVSIPFDDRHTAVAASSTLSADEAATLIEWISVMYQDEQYVKTHEQLLNLLSLLLDSHSTQLLNDDATHEKLLQSAALIGAMAALAGTFEELNVRHAARSSIDASPDVIPDYRIRKVTLQRVKRLSTPHSSKEAEPVSNDVIFNHATENGFRKGTRFSPNGKNMNAKVDGSGSIKARNDKSRERRISNGSRAQ